MDTPVFSFPFHDPKSYKKFIRLWKQDYRKVSSAIRQLRYSGQALARKGEYQGGNQMATQLLISGARELMVMREQAKVEAGRQMAKRHREEDLARRDVILDRHDGDVLLEALEL